MATWMDIQEDKVAEENAKKLRVLSVAAMALAVVFVLVFAFYLKP